jgi:RNA polymerase sigma factor (TIGR02999 family)
MSPKTKPTGTVSQLLKAWGRGDLQAREDLVPLVYQELRERAAAYLRRERQDHTLQPTALVNEAYIRLLGQQRVTWLNRAQFFGVAAQIMRRILVDHARERQAAKRPGGVRVTLDDGVGTVQPLDCELLMLNDVLQELARIDERQAHIVELKYFGGLSEEEVAAALSLSRATISREWQSARAWMYRRMTEGRAARS